MDMDLTGNRFGELRDMGDDADGTPSLCGESLQKPNDLRAGMAIERAKAFVDEKAIYFDVAFLLRNDFGEA